MLASHAWPGDTGRRRHATALTLTLGVHAIVVLAIMLQVTRPTPARSSVMLTTFDAVNEASTHAAPQRPKQPRKVVPPPPLTLVAPPPAIVLPTLNPVVAASLAQAEAQASSGGCDLTAPVQAALRTSETVRLALPAIPRARRSVANAIAIWDQRWVQPDTLLDAPTLATIRDTIATTITAASPACRLQSQGGPRLIYLPGQADTTILALGSGQWTWQQVADSAQMENAQIDNAQMDHASAAIALAAGPPRIDLSHASTAIAGTR